LLKESFDLQKHIDTIVVLF